MDMVKINQIKSPYFTVFTPTFNRAHTLGGVYESLMMQTFRDFEWIIVDDGSTDNTYSLVSEWKKEANFLIHYYYQKNQGKHIASNRGVKEAKGELFLFFDSDDRCVPETLEVFKKYWDKIPESEKQAYCAINVLCTGPDGKIIGPEYPLNELDVDSVWEQIKLRTGAERWGVNRTSALKCFPFPEIPNEKFISEGIVWNRISLAYKAKFINEKLRIYKPCMDGLSANSVKIRVNNPMGTRLYYSELFKMPIPAIEKLKAIINYNRFSYDKINLWELLRDSPSFIISFIFIPPSYLLYLCDKRKYLLN